jgi:two-component system, OmpR family, sensor histidine kinase CiaH
MFTKASLRLTAWYVAILMALSLMFSSWLFTEASNEVRTGLDAQLLRPYANLLPKEEIGAYLDQQYEASRWRIIGSLTLMNVGVLVAGSFISYFLARRTLQPIEDALDAQNRFTADASHELRTPLTSMKTEIEVALRDPKLPAKEARELLKSNVEEIDRLTKLSDGLLILARTGDAPALKKVAVADIAQKVAHRFEARANAKHMKLVTQLSPANGMAEPTQLDMLAGILLDNAIKYAPEKSTITVATTIQDNYACLTVHNEGSVISAKDLPHIFDRFYRADTSRTGGHTAGHGLGLSIAEKLAANMNGSIAVRSTKKAGTTFTVRVASA